MLAQRNNRLQHVVDETTGEIISSRPSAYSPSHGSIPCYLPNKGLAVPVNPPKPQCQNPRTVSARCVNGRHNRFTICCGKIDKCSVALSSWVARVRSKIKEGLEKWPDRFRFLTLTADPRNYDLEAFLKSWKAFRKRYLRGPWFRVYELQKNGRLHIHCLHQSGAIPLISTAKDGQSIQSYLQQQTVAARNFLLHLQHMGFGIIAYNRPTYGSDGPLSAYLSKYLSKTEKVIRRSDGRSLRLYGYSRNWGYKQMKVRTYRYGYLRVTDSVPDSDCGCCNPLSNPLEEEDARSSRKLQWLQTLPPNHYLARLNLLEKTVRGITSRVQSQRERGERPSCALLRFVQKEWRDLRDAARWDYGYFGPHYLIDEIRPSVPDSAYLDSAPDTYTGDGPGDDYADRPRHYHSDGCRDNYLLCPYVAYPDLFDALDDDQIDRLLGLTKPLGCATMAPSQLTLEGNNVG